MIQCIISGGQTGVDQGALEGARDAGVDTGGWAPRGWMTEEGSCEGRLSMFGLKEHPGGYDARTAANVADADATIIYGKPTTPGSKLTLRFARESGKPWAVVEDPAKWDGKAWIEANNIRVLNVAGPRESRRPGVQAEVQAFIARMCRSLVGCLVIDTETTGTDPDTARIWQLGTLTADGKVTSGARYLNPGMPVPRDAARAVGLTQAEEKHIAASPPWDDALTARLNESIQRRGVVLGWNILHYDKPILERYGVSFAGAQIVDVMVWAVNLIGDVENHQLGTVAAALGCAEPGHRADADCRMTWAIWRTIEAQVMPRIADQELLAELAPFWRVDRNGEPTLARSWRMAPGGLTPAELLERDPGLYWWIVARMRGDRGRAMVAC